MLTWSTRVISAGTLVAVAWVAITAFAMLVHGQPTYVVLAVAFLAQFAR